MNVLYTFAVSVDAVSGVFLSKKYSNKNSMTEFFCAKVLKWKKSFSLHEMNNLIWLQGLQQDVKLFPLTLSRSVKGAWTHNWPLLFLVYICIHETNKVVRKLNLYFFFLVRRTTKKSSLMREKPKCFIFSISFIFFSCWATRKAFKEKKIIEWWT